MSRVRSAKEQRKQCQDAYFRSEALREKVTSLSNRSHVEANTKINQVGASIQEDAFHCTLSYSFV